MTDYDPHLRRLMRTLTHQAAAQNTTLAAWLRQEFDRGLDGVASAAAPAWHGHQHRISTAVTLPADHSLWLGTLDLGTGGSLTIESGAILQIG
jgi:hypothetical protein